MARTLLIRGLLAGLLAGLLMFAFGRIYGEPQVDRAIAFESAEELVKAQAMSNAPAAEETPELVSRRVQAGIGLFTGVVVYSTAFGGLFALVFAYAYGRVGSGSPRVVSALLATGGLVAVYIVPNLKYPANPPAIGEPGTIGMRTALYFIMLAISVTAMVGSLALRKRLLADRDAWTANLAVAAAYVLFVAAAGLLLPSVNEVPDTFPAVVLWQFRVASLGMQVVMWATIGLAFGILAERILESRPPLTRGRRVQVLVR